MTTRFACSTFTISTVTNKGALEFGMCPTSLTVMMAQILLGTIGLTVSADKFGGAEFVPTGAW
ncbi:MAG: hypothetical protein ACRBCJ_02460 [Hyphomicrobiaceae bacterium]